MSAGVPQDRRGSQALRDARDLLRPGEEVEAEPSRVQELVEELAGMELNSSVIKQVYAVTGRYDLIALIESPDIASLGD